MTNYRVIYEIDVEADTHEQAAFEACELMRNSESWLPILEVIEWDPATNAPTPEAQRKFVDCEEPSGRFKF